MKPMDLEQGLHEARLRLQALKRASGASMGTERALLDEALEQLAVELEELRVARDELSQQNEALVAAQCTLAQERRRYRELFDLAPDAYLVTSYAGLLREVNQVAATLLGWEQEFLQGKPITLFIAWESRPAFRQLLQRLRQGQEVWGWETEMQGADGRPFPAALDVTCERAEGRLFGFRWIVRDITERKRAQALLENARDALEQEVQVRAADLLAANASLTREVTLRRQAQVEQQKFVQLVENASDFIAIADPEGHLLFLNPAGCRLAEVTEADLMNGLWLSELWTEATWAQVQHTGFPVLRETGLWRGEGQLRCLKTGRLADVDIGLWGVPASESEQALCLCIVQHDMTERVKVERMKAEFISTVSHELRTPLTAIAGALRLMVHGVTGELPAQAQAMVQIAHRNSERLVRLVNDLLDIHKIETGRMTCDLRPVEVMPLVEQALEGNRPGAERFGVRIVLEKRMPDAEVLADAGRLDQVLTHLLSNAAKFSPPGEMVRVTVERSGDAVRIAVTDCGPGIPEEFQAQLFERFTQADASDSRRKGGAGVGLSLARALVEKMGGRIGFDTVQGSGSTFYIDLPEYRDSREDYADLGLYAPSYL